MKRLIILATMVGVVGAAQPPCMFPPFLGVQAATVAPHVALVLDYSGSMRWSAFPDAVYGIFPQNFHPDFEYYGSFDVNYYYKYDLSGQYFYKYAPYDGGPAFDESNELFWGNLLNWAQWMSRIQMLKRVLTGEHMDVVFGDSAIVKLRKIRYVYLHPSSRYWWRWYLYNIPWREYRLSSDRLLYFYFYNDGFSEANSGKVGGSFEVLILKRRGGSWRVEKTIIPKSKWRLKDHLNNLMGIIARFSDENRDGLVDDGKPWWSLIKFNSGVARILDQKQNDIPTLETHIQGEWASGSTPTRYAVEKVMELFDDRGSSGNHNPNTDIFFDIYCGIPQGIWCKKAYAIIMSDGFWNTGGEPVDETHYAHTTDLRRDLQDQQNVTFFTIHIFSPEDQEGKNALKWLALWGGFNDVDGNKKPGHFTSYPSPDSRRDNFSLPSPYDALDYQEWDEDMNGVPDNYYEANTGQQIEDALREIFKRINQETASATGAPTFPVSSTGEGFTFQAFFSPMRKNEYNKEIYWIGYLNSLWVDKGGNIREDSDQDGVLNFLNDKIVRFKYNSSLGQTFVYLYQDINGNGKFEASESTVVDSYVIYDIKAILKFGDKLKDRNSSSRIIKYVRKNLGSYTLADFSSTNLSELRRLLNVSTTAKADTIVKYIRGQDFSNLRSRFMSGDIWKLGDIVHSTPVYVSSPQERYDLIYGDPTYLSFYQHYKNGRGILIVGANDGILHIFNAGVFEPITGGGFNKGRIVNKLTSYSLGDEIIGIIPRAVLPHLKYLSEIEYQGCHIYYVDGKPYVTDAQIFKSDAIHPQGWGTILIQGMNFGGVPETLSSPMEILSSSYLILDITDPSNVNNFKVITEFSDTLLGFTTSYPAIVKIDTTWYLAVGSGPTVLPDGYSDHPGLIYIINLKNPNVYYKLNIGSMFGIDSSFTNDLTSTDVALTFSADRIFFALNKIRPDGTGEAYIFMIKTNYDPNPYNWDIYRIFQVNAPVLAELSPVVDEMGDIWVLFGTGRFWTVEDFNLTQQQYLIGFKVDETKTQTLSDLIDVTDAAVISSGTADSVISSLGRFSFRSFENFVSTQGGWYIRLQDDERCISRPAVVGGAAIFTTLNPLLSDTSGVCNPCESGQAGGSGRIFGLYVKTGTAHYKPILGEVTNLGGGKERIEREKTVSGLPSEPTLHIGEEGGSIFVQTTEGVIERYDVNIPLAIKKGTIIWKKER